MGITKEEVKMARRIIAVVVMIMLVASVAVAQPMEKATPNLSGIKEVSPVSTSANANKVYEIPMTAIMQKADGSGEVEVAVAPIKVTKVQLQNGIAQANKANYATGASN